MNSTLDLKKQLLQAARENGASSVLFRNAISQKLGLNITDSECFSFLAAKGSSDPTELAKHTGLSSGATTAMLDRLQAAGFISRRPNPNDRRGTIVEVNKKAMRKFRPLVAGAQKANLNLLGSYTNEELKLITDFLKRFSKNVIDQAELISKGD